MKARRCFGLFLLLILGLSLSRAGNRDVYPLPENRGTAGTLAALQKLPLHARVLEITAHPDDENAGTLTWLSRKSHARTALLCLTRGEGGQNVLGSEKGEALGLVRTGELLEACKYYGVELYFSDVVDFGFSKSAEETLSKWGRQETLRDLVRFVRRWRPTIIISRFHGNSDDGHGHHQAAGILAGEAFTAAADPRRYPGELEQGLQPWQAKKLYVNVRSETGPGFPPNDWTARIPVGDYDPILGRSYREIAAEGYSKHRSQGTGAYFALPGQAYEYYRLVNSIVPAKPREDSVFDSIDTSLSAILELAGDEKPAVSFLQEDLDAVEQAAAEALRTFQVSRPESSAPAVARGARILAESIRKIELSSLSGPTKEALEDALAEKLQDFHEAVNAALGISLVARTDDATQAPGVAELVAVRFYNRGTEPISIERVTLSVPHGWKVTSQAEAPAGKSLAGSDAVFNFTVDIARDAKATEAFWHLGDAKDARYKADPTDNVFAPFGRPEISAEATYSFRGSEIKITAAAKAQFGDPMRGADFVDFQVVPEISVIISPDTQIVPVSQSASAREFHVSLTNNVKSGAQGTVKLLSSAGWRVTPTELPFALTRKGEVFTGRFVVQVPAKSAGNYRIEAVATSQGHKFRRGYQVVSYPENWTRCFYRPAVSEVKIFDVKVARGLLVGYINGAGDEVPGALEQLGIRVQTLSASDLAFGDLMRFSALVTGIRAYNVNEDLRANNSRILDYVAQGGTLIVQYVRPLTRPAQGNDGSPFPFGPYPMSNSDEARITVEDSPVRILDQLNSVFNKPNKITQTDFEGWVQERGLYFMTSWDDKYSSLLSGNDPGEKPESGGMLVARYGKGYYVYTAYAWFRQLPAGVPGAFRIFANLISLGK